MALPLLAAERQASPVCVWAGPRSGATARRPGMASTGHKVKVLHAIRNNMPNGEISYRQLPVTADAVKIRIIWRG
ncbi:hypothetical protein GGI43DRAFT_235517 [Trichoderma evansii]